MRWWKVDSFTFDLDELAEFRFIVASPWWWACNPCSNKIHCLLTSKLICPPKPSALLWLRLQFIASRLDVFHFVIAKAVIAVVRRWMKLSTPCVWRAAINKIHLLQEFPLHSGSTEDELPLLAHTTTRIPRSSMLHLIFDYITRRGGGELSRQARLF